MGCWIHYVSVTSGFKQIVAHNVNETKVGLGNI